MQRKSYAPERSTPQRTALGRLIHEAATVLLLVAPPSASARACAWHPLCATQSVDVHSPSDGMVPMRGTDFRAISLRISEATSLTTLDRIEVQLRAAKADKRQRLLLHKLAQRRQELSAREKSV